MKIGKIQGASGRSQMSALLDQAFPVPTGSHFFDDFPVWDEEHSPGAMVLRLGAFEGERLLSCAAMRVAELKVPGSAKRISCAVIGAVATSEEARGKGHASQLVEELDRVARQARVSLLLLWGSEHSMYRRLGFELCGRQAVAQLARVVAAGGAGVAGAVSTGWVDGVFGCLARRGDGLVLADTDRAWVAAHRNVEWFWTGPAAAPSAWAAIGRGIDLGGYVHEWGGDPAALRRVLAAVLARHPRALVLGSEQGLQGLGLEADAVEALCLAKVLDPVAVMRAYRPSNLVQAERTAQGWQVACGSTRFTNLTDPALSLALFGSPNHADTSLNLPLWVWGLDAG